MKNLILCLILISCSCTVQKIRKTVKNSEVFEQGFAGIMLYDPVRGRTIYAQNEKLYFIPASNTKLFTFYTSQRILEEELNGLNYLIRGDSLIFWGSADPTFLHPDFESQIAFDFLKNRQEDLYYANNFDQVKAYGPGWSWDWYNYYYATERSAFPIYGNVVRFVKNLEEPFLTYSPVFFKDEIKINPRLFSDSYRIDRDKDFNSYSYLLGRQDSLAFESDKPFITSDDLLVEMLEDTLRRKIVLIDYALIKNSSHQEVKTMATDSVYKQMMLDSDNFLAEQLLLISSDKLFDSLSTEAIIDYSLSNFLDDLPDRPKWVDGSGLSSRNMFTPRTIISLLGKIKEEVPEETIFRIFPAGGKAGTIKNWYKPDNEHPYIYAKTGTLSNSVCLSGYLLTKSDKVLYFSFLLNNFTVGSEELKKEMEKILYMVHTRY